MAAFQATVRHHFVRRNALFAVCRGEHEILAIERGVGGMGAIQLGRHLAFVQHAGAFAGDADDVNVFALEVMLLHQHDDRARIAALGHNGNRLATESGGCV